MNLGRQAIAADSNWNEGNYNTKNTIPNKGLAVARMAAHISLIFLKKVFKKNLEENYKKEKILNLVLMLTFKLKVI